jgi:DNA repair protein RadC
LRSKGLLHKATINYIFARCERKEKTMKGQKTLSEYCVDKVAVKLIKEETVFTTSETENFTSPQGVAKFMMPFLDEMDRECLYVLLLNTKNTLQAINLITIGTLNMALIGVREVFKPAILANAVNIILVHNHPSGCCQPSKDDSLVTKKLIAAGKMLDTEVHDHIIVSHNNFYSFRENGVI